MRPSRRLALLLPLGLFAAGCADMQQETPKPAGQFAALLEASDPAVDTSVAVMDSFERRATREERAVGFALGRTVAAPRRPGTGGPSAAEAAGEVISPAFTALGDYAHVLGEAATGAAPEPRPSVGGEALAQAVTRALPTTSATVPPAVRDGGIAAIAGLSNLAESAGTRGRVSAQALAREAEPQVLAVTALLRAVIGMQPGEGTRGAIAARRDQMEAAHLRLMEAARRDSGLGVAGRYALFHQVAALRDQDPLPGTLAALIDLLNALDAAQTAIAAGDPMAEAKVGAFDAALSRLMTLTGQEPAPAAPE